MTRIQINQSQQNEGTENGRFLTFALGEEEFGIDIGYVTEIISMQPVFRLPEVPDYIRGIVNLRGKIIPVIDLRLMFKKEAAEDTERTCIIVIDTGYLSVGLIVDKVTEVTSISSENISPPPNIRTSIRKNYIAGIGKGDDRIIILINCERLFQDEEVNSINEIKERVKS